MEASPGAAPVIGVTIYARDARGHVHLPELYVRALRRAGALPWLIAPGEARLDELLSHLDGLVLSGGGDVDPALYAGRPSATLYGVDRERDEMELALVRLVLERRLPTLGICRGCQLINVALGGTLIEHLPDEPPGGGAPALEHRGAGPGTTRLHPVQLEGDSRLASILGAGAAPSSSSHHQAVRRLAAELRLTARAADGVIEAFELPGQPFFLGVQWHPEDTAEHDPAQQRLFEALVGAARRQRHPT